MKNIINFKSFNEGIIKPTFKIDINDTIKIGIPYSIIELDKLFNSKGSLSTRFMLIDEFKSHLKTEDEINGVPTKPITPNLRFGVYLEDIDSLVVCVTREILSFSKMEIDLINEILRHESIHREQSHRSSGSALAYSLDRSPVNNPKSYFSHHTELMAYARSYVDQCKVKGESENDIMNNLRSGFTKSRNSWIPNVLLNVGIDDKNFKRFKKYVYQYIMSDKKE